MKKIMKSMLALTLVGAMLAMGSVSAFAAKGKGNGARLRDGSCGNECIYDGTGQRDGSCDNLGTGRGNGGTGKGLGTGGMRLQDGSCYQ